MLERIDLYYFLISFCLGIMIVYSMNPKPEIVYKFPSPTNLNIQYKDKSDSCYKYSYKEVECTDNALQQPIIEDFKKKN